MASLIEEELARRDTAAPAKRASTRSTYMAPADRLRAAEIDRRSAKDEGDMAAREAILAQRASTAEANALRMKEDSLRRGEYQDNRIRLAEDTARLQEAEARLKEQEQLTKNARTEEVLTHATNFLRDAVGMDPSKPDFDQQLQKLYAGYPLALAHPSVEKWQSYHLPLREKFVAEEIARRKPATTIGGDRGTETISVGDSENKITTRRPLGTPEQELARDKTEHDRLEAVVNAKGGEKGGIGPFKFTGGKQDEKVIKRLNALKSKLDYDLLDESTGAVIPNSRPSAIRAAAAVPAAPVVAAPTVAPVAAAAADTGGAVSKLELAKRALEDPNASEAHKAAAKRLLGQ